MQSIKFYDHKHLDFFTEISEEIKIARHIDELDSYQKSLVYSLGLLPDCRNHIDEIYDISANEIKLEVLRAGWQTSGSTRITLFAFNLWNSYSPEDAPESVFVSSLFAGDPHLMPYLFEAIRLRFPRNDEPEYDVLDGDGIVVYARVSHDLATIYKTANSEYSVVTSKEITLNV